MSVAAAFAPRVRVQSRPAPLRGAARRLCSREAAYVPVTVVVAVAALFDVSGSSGFPLTVAVLLIVPALVGVTTIVIVAVAPLARDPTVHATVPFLGSSSCPSTACRHPESRTRT
jgi:hypothetical protein